MKTVRTLAILYLSTILFSCTTDKNKLINVIASGEEKLLDSKMEIKDTSAVSSLRKNYILFADTYIADSASGTYLFRAADLSIGLNQTNEAVQLLDRIILKYPDHPKSASALFYQAFIYDSYLHLTASAMEKYRLFINKYPNDQMVPSASATLLQLETGLSDEELVKSFQHKNDSLSAVGQKN